MLKVFRDNLKYLSWILWLVVALFIFFIWADFGTGLGRRGGGRFNGDANVVAHVGSQVITIDEFERQYRQLEQLYRQVLGEQFTPEAAKQMGVPQNALNQAVSQKIFLAEAKRMGLVATDDEVRDHILQDQVFKDEQGRFVGEDRYREIVQAMRYPGTAAYEEEIRQQVLVRKLVDILEANLYVSDQEVEAAYREQVERARIRYVQLPRSRFLQGAAVSDAEVKSYFDQHKQEFRLPEQREAAYLLVDSNQMGAGNVDEKALRDYYQQHQEEFSRPGAAGAQPFEEVRESIRQRLSAERSSALAESRAKELAKRLADAKPKSADALKGLADLAKGITFGETGRFAKQEPVGSLGFAPAFSNAAFALQKGSVSEAVQTPRGWAVLYLKDVHPPRIPELKDVEPRVRTAVARQKQQDLALAELRQAKAAGKTLDQVAAGLSLEVKESSEFGTQGAIPGIGFNPELAKAALALSTGQVGGPVSDAQGAILFEVKDRKSWDPIQFAAAREQTREAVRREKLNALESSLLERRRRELDVQVNSELLKRYGIETGAASQGQPG